MEGVLTGNNKVRKNRCQHYVLLCALLAVIAFIEFDENVFEHI